MIRVQGRAWASSNTSMQASCPAGIPLRPPHQTGSSCHRHPSPCVQRPGARGCSRTPTNTGAQGEECRVCVGDVCSRRCAVRFGRDCVPVGVRTSRRSPPPTPLLLQLAPPCPPAPGPQPPGSPSPPLAVPPLFPPPGAAPGARGRAWWLPEFPGCRGSRRTAPPGPATWPRGPGRRSASPAAPIAHLPARRSRLVVGMGKPLSSGEITPPRGAPVPGACDALQNDTPAQG